MKLFGFYSFMELNGRSLSQNSFSIFLPDKQDMNRKTEWFRGAIIWNAMTVVM